MMLGKLDVLLRIKSYLSFEKNRYKGLCCYSKMLDLFDKKQMYNNAIRGEENALEHMELYHIDDSDEL